MMTTKRVIIYFLFFNFVRIQAIIYFDVKKPKIFLKRKKFLLVLIVEMEDKLMGHTQTQNEIYWRSKVSERTKKNYFIHLPPNQPNEIN